MVSKKELIDFLSKDPIRNVNLIYFAENYTLNSVEFEGDSVLVKGKSDKDWVYFSSKDESEFSALAERIKAEDIYFAIVEDWMLPYIRKGRQIIWILTCFRMFFPEKSIPQESIFDVKPLTIRDAAHIYENSKYKKYTSVAYIKERIKAGFALGIYDKRALVGWIMTHDDGAMGLLNVLTEYRRKGFGTDITYALIREIRKAGKIPFVHIEEDNINSMELASKMGFEKDRKVHWLKAELSKNK